MRHDLLSEIEDFLRTENIGEHRFGILAAKNGRLVERLRSGGRIWPDTAARVREYMAERRNASSVEPAPKQRASA